MLAWTECLTRVASQGAPDAEYESAQANPGAAIFRCDVATDPPPVPDAAFSTAVLGAAPAADPAFAASEVLIGELESCDAFMIGTPMHNYGVPAVLKAWIDQVVRIRRTFQSMPAGNIGMRRERPVFLVVASGGWFTGPSRSGTPAQPDFLIPYLHAALGTTGLNDLSVRAPIRPSVRWRPPGRGSRSWFPWGPCAGRVPAPRPRRVDPFRPHG